MFSGIGGFELGIQRILPDATCVGYSEIDKYAIQVYERRFNGHKNYGDATKINARDLPDFDLLVGGFPCQAFSIAGKRKGFEDTRGTLFFDIARILAEKRPRHLVLENVKGLLSHEQGETFQTILGVLADLGYRVEWQVLNSKDFGVPQNRERVYIVGHIGGECSGQVFPIGGTNKKSNFVLPAKGVQKRKEARFNTIKYEDSKNSVDDYIKSNNWEDYVYDSAMRRLTPLECERLQGFPDGFTELGIDTKELVTYKKYGNIELCNKAQIEKIKNQNVRFRVVAENKKPISVIASCTTSDGSEMELPSCQSESSNPKVSVHIVIDRSEESEHWECAINTIKCGDSMMTRYTLRKNENNQVEMATSEIATGAIPTLKSWKPISVDGSSPTKLSTISTQINWIIESLISTYAHAQNMELSMHSSDDSSKTVSIWEISYLKMASIERLSDSERYKMCGNAVTVNVVEAVMSNLINVYY